MSRGRRTQPHHAPGVCGDAATAVERYAREAPDGVLLPLNDVLPLDQAIGHRVEGVAELADLEALRALVKPPCASKAARTPISFARPA